MEDVFRDMFFFNPEVPIFWGETSATSAVLNLEFSIQMFYFGDICDLVARYAVFAWPTSIVPPNHMRHVAAEVQLSENLTSGDQQKAMLINGCVSGSCIRWVTGGSNPTFKRGKTY